MFKLFRLLGAETKEDAVQMLVLAGFLLFEFAIVAFGPWPKA